jgi:hypothetical protein
MTVCCHPANYFSTHRLAVCHHLQPADPWHWCCRLLSMMSEFLDPRLSLRWALRLDTLLAVRNLGSLRVSSIRGFMRSHLGRQLGNEIIPAHTSTVGSGTTQSRVFDAELSVAPPREELVCRRSPHEGSSLNKRGEVTIHDIVKRS